MPYFSWQIISIFLVLLLLLSPMYKSNWPYYNQLQVHGPSSMSHNLTLALCLTPTPHHAFVSIIVPALSTPSYYCISHQACAYSFDPLVCRRGTFSTA